MLIFSFVLFNDIGGQGLEITNTELNRLSETENIVYVPFDRNEQTILELTEDIKKNTANFNSLFNSGIVHYERGKYQDAISDFTKAINITDYVQRKEVYFYRGNTYKLINEPMKAIADFDKCIQIDESYSDAIADRGLAYYEMGQTEKALIDLKEAIRINPLDSLSHQSVLRIYLLQKSYTLAIEEYDKAIESNPDLHYNYANRARIFTKIGKYKIAISDFRSAIKLGSKNNGVFLSLIELNLIGGSYDEVISIAKKIYPGNLNIKQKSLCLYFVCIAKNILGEDTIKIERNLRLTLKMVTDNNKFWSFGLIDNWLDSTNLEISKKTYILNLTKAVKME
jgi:tetratricopeptide (TPR) repeat protein